MQTSYSSRGHMPQCQRSCAEVTSSRASGLLGEGRADLCWLQPRGNNRPADRCTSGEISGTLILQDIGAEGSAEFIAFFWDHLLGNPAA